MGRSRLVFVLALFGSVVGSSVLTNEASAGGTEFPADGTRGLGRGGTGFLRADDPTVMIRNPALLADLWGDQALLGAHLLLVDQCFRPTGAYGWGVTNPDVSNYGDGPVLLQAQPGDLDENGDPLTPGFRDEPFPEICYDGPAPFIPRFGLTMKLADDLGVGLGFFPPDSQTLSAFGRRDGTIDTPNGRRPNPLRYYTTNQNISFFSLTQSIGWRIAPWIRVGGSFVWNLVVANARSWTTAVDGRQPRNDVATDVFFRDLFVPGFAASVHIVPIDAIDIAASFRWSEAIDGKAKLDLTSGYFGTGDSFAYFPASRPDTLREFDGVIPTTTVNQPGFVFAPPVYVPQLAAGIRFADRIVPRTRDWEAAREGAGQHVIDHMSTERWDIELNFIYYFTSQYDTIGVTTSAAEIDLTSVDPDGTIGTIERPVGDCIGEEIDGICDTDKIVQVAQGGKDQMTFRVGGDYNILPGIFSVRAGASYEMDGADVEQLNVRNYMLRRIGAHGGLTLRVADKTDISIGFAHFIHRAVRLQVNPGDALSTYPPRFQSAEYNFIPGLGVPANEDPANPYRDDLFDGTAMYDQPSAMTLVGPFYVNAGSFTSSLSTLSLSFTQHF